MQAVCLQPEVQKKLGRGGGHSTGRWMEQSYVSFEKHRFVFFPQDITVTVCIASSEFHLTDANSNSFLNCRQCCYAI